jgi:hypothetical protein
MVFTPELKPKGYNYFKDFPSDLYKNKLPNPDDPFETFGESMAEYVIDEYLVKNY